MGNDGGSIARRTELVRTKAKAPQVDKRNQALAAWLMCALSKMPLSPPVVSCPLGKLYNKDALIEYLISPPGTADTSGGNAGAFGADGHATASHIRSLKDVVELTLTPNPDAVKEDADAPIARFVCPLSQRPMNGNTRFVYVKHCGCVANELALKQLETAEDKAGAAKEGGACKICGKVRPSGEPEILITLNPQGEELEKMKKAWSEHVAKEAEAKRLKKLSKKRKQGENGADQDEPASKQVKVAEPLKATGPRLPAAVLAAQEAVRAKAASSPAIASLYSKGDNKQEQSWMTRGTYARFA